MRVSHPTCRASRFPKRRRSLVPFCFESCYRDTSNVVRRLILSNSAAYSKNKRRRRRTPAWGVPCHYEFFPCAGLTILYILRLVKSKFCYLLQTYTYSNDATSSMQTQTHNKRKCLGLRSQPLAGSRGGAPENFCQTRAILMHFLAI